MNPLMDTNYVLGLNFRNDQNKFFATPTQQVVFTTRRGLQRPGGSHQYLIALIVTKGVVDMFEVIDVHDQYGTD